MSSLTRATSIYIGAAAFSAAVPFAVLPIIARWLGPAEFGVMGSYLALVNIAVVLAGLSVHGIISVVHFRQDPGEVPSYVRGALRLLVFTSIPILMFLVLFGGAIAPVTAVPASWAWTIGMVAIGQFVVSLGLAVFQAREQAFRYGLIQVGLAVGWGIATLLFVGVFHMGWQGRAAGQLAAVFVMAVITLWLLSSEGMLRRSVAKAPLVALLRFGIPLVPHSLAGAVMAGADRLVLTGLVGPDTAGQYFAAFQIAAVLTVAAAAMNQAWIPWLYRRLSQPTVTTHREVVVVTYFVFAALIVGASLLVISASWLLPLVVGPKFSPAIPLLRWLAPAAAVSGMYYFVTNYLFFSRRTGLLSIITVASSLLQLALMVWLVPRWGAEGAAVSVLLTSVFYWLTTWVAANAVVPMPWTLGLRRQA